MFFEWCGILAGVSYKHDDKKYGDPRNEREEFIQLVICCYLTSKS